MKKVFHAFLGATAVAAMLAAATPASATPTAAGAKCHSAITGALVKYQGTLLKNLTGCHKSRSAGKIAKTVDCNSVTGADLKLGLTAAKAAVKAAIDKSCVGPALTEVIAADYPRCPTPKRTVDDGGATTGIDDSTELAACLTQTSDHWVQELGKQAMGAPALATPLSKGQQACQGAIGKGLASLLKAGSGMGKCQAAANVTDLTLSGSCSSAATTALGAAATALNAVIDASCGTVNMPNQAAWLALGTCGQSKDQQKACAVGRTGRPLAYGLNAAAIEFPNDGAGSLTCAAGSADVIINAGYGVKQTSTRLDTGWNGLAHNVDVLDGYKGKVLLSNCDNDCANCEVRMDTSAGNCRCENDPTIECSTIAGADAACGGNTCHCMFGPPLALSASGTPTCVVNRFVGDFDGSTQDVGAYDVSTHTKALVYTGISNVQPCPVCSGASIGSTGTCSGGPRNGLSCTTDATDSSFGNTSFDCPPASASNVSGTGLAIALQFKTGTASITAGISSSSFCNGGTCHCSTCSGDATIGCSSNSDCAAASAGTCGTDFSGNNPKQNNCSALSDCKATSDPTLAVCDNDFDSYCDGAVRANGRGIITCSTDDDCNEANTGVSGGAGACTLSQQRSCFLPTVTATGTQGIFNSVGVSSFCSGRTSSPTINAAGGLPGPGRVKLDFDFNLYCGTGATQYMSPLGSNCP